MYCSSKNRTALCPQVHGPLCLSCHRHSSLQSDREKSEGLPVAPFMDRDKVTKATAQIGFIKFVLIPMFETMTKVSDHAAGTAAINTHVHTCMYVHFRDVHGEYTLSVQQQETHVHTGMHVDMHETLYSFIICCHGDGCLAAILFSCAPPHALQRAPCVRVGPLVPTFHCPSMPALRPSQLYQLLALLSFQASP